LLEGLKNSFDLFEIIKSSFVFGFLPSLCGVFLVEKVPKFDILTILDLELMVTSFKKFNKNALLSPFEIRALEEILL
jgi:hypothetical protein